MNLLKIWEGHFFLDCFPFFLGFFPVFWWKEGARKEGRKEGRKKERKNERTNERKKERSNLLLKNERKASFS